MPDPAPLMEPRGCWVGPSDPAWLSDEEGGVECSECVTGIDFGPGVTYSCPSED